MDKKGALKISILGVSLLVVLFVIFMTFSAIFSSAEIVKESYALGEKVKIDLGGINNYKIKIITPTQTLVKTGTQDSFIFKPNELGKYKVILSYNGKQEEYFFEVNGKKINEPSNTNQSNISDASISNEFRERKGNIKFKIGADTIGTRELKLNKKDGNKNVEIKREIPTTWKIKDSSKIKLIWEEGNKEIEFTVLDLNNDSIIDEINWTIDNLNSEQTYIIIVITKAEHLDNNRTFISDIYDSVKGQDDVWSESINDGEYVRVTFEKNLTNENDITIWPRIVSGNPKVEIYEIEGNVKIAEFSSINQNEYNKVYLTTLNGSQDTFDLRIMGGSLEFDHIIDPIISNFTDSAATGTISTNVAAPTTVGSLNTSLPAGNNLIFASVQILSTDAGAENIPAGGLILKNNAGAAIASNQYAIQVSTANLNNNYFIIANHTGAGANEVYNVSAYSSATAVVTEAKITAISGLTNMNVSDSGSVAFAAATETQITSIPTNFPAGNNVIIASVQIDNGATGQVIAADGIKIINGSGATLSSNEYEINFSNAAPTDKQSIVLLAYETGAPANAQYNVSVLGPQAGDAEAKVVVFRTVGAQFLDGGSVNLGNAVSTNIGNMTSTFPTGSELLVIAAGQVDDTDAGVETLAADTGFTLRESQNTVSANDLIMSGFAAFTTAGDGIRHTLLWRNSTTVTNTMYNLTAIASALRLRAEVKMLILQLTDFVIPNVTLNAPVNYYNSSSREIIFNVTANDETELANVSLWTNFSGTFAINQTNSSGTNGDYLFNVTGIADGNYIWAVQACDSSNNCNISQNRSLTVDNTFPLISFELPTPSNNAVTRITSLFVNISLTETNEKNITFYLYNITSQVNITTLSAGSRTINWTNLENGIYYYNVSATDAANNINSTETRTLVIDLNSPAWINQNQSENTVVQGETNNLWANWTDNYALNDVWLATNETGTWRNYTVRKAGLNLEDFTDNSNVYIDPISANADINDTLEGFVRDGINLSYNYDSGAADDTFDVVINTSSINISNYDNVSYYVKADTSNFHRTRLVVVNSSGSACTASDPVTLSDTSFTLITVNTAGITGCDKNAITEFRVRFSDDIDTDTGNGNIILDELYLTSDLLREVITNFTWKNASVPAGQSVSWRIIMNDTSGNINQTDIMTFSIQDPLFPTWSNNISFPVSPLTYSAATFYQFNVSWSDNIAIQTVKIQHNFTGTMANYSVSGNVGSVYFYNYTGIPAGGYVWQMIGNDSFGNTNQTDFYNYVVNKASSSVNLTLNGVDGNITVQVGNNNVNLSALRLGGEGNIKLFRNGTLINEGQPTISNLSNFTVLGDYNITVIYEETQNFTSSSRTNFLFVIDNLFPNITLNSPINGYNSSSRSAVFNATIREDFNLTNVSLWADFSGNFVINQTNSSGTNGDYLFNVTGIADGNYIWAVQACDSSNNCNISQNRSLTVDNTFPLVDYGIGTENSNVNFSRNWIYANVTVTEANEINITFKLFNTSSLYNGTTYTNLARTINWTSVPDGLYAYNVTIADVANNVNTTATRTITLDTTAPLITAGTANVTNLSLNGYARINCTVIDVLVGLDTVLIRASKPTLPQQNYSTSVLIGNTRYSDIQLNEAGNWTFTCYANDTLNNFASFHIGNISVIQQADAPSAPVLQFPIDEANLSSIPQFNWSNSTDPNGDTITYILEIDDNAGFTDSEYYNGSITETNDPTEDTSVTLSADGQYYWRVRSSDGGLNSSFSASRSFVLDRSPPSISLVFPANNSNSTIPNINFTWNVTDNLNFEIYCNLTLDGSTNASNILSVNANMTNYTISRIVDGTHNWNVTCRDRVNSNVSVTRIFTVYTISNPSILNATLGSDNASVVLRWSNTTKATSYNIYISTNYSAGFSSTPNFTGITDLNFTDNAANTSLTRFYKVGAVYGPAENITVLSVGKIQPPQLSSGFNLIGGPLNLTNYILNNGVNNGYNPPTRPANCIQSLFRYNGTKFQETTNDNGVWTPAIGDSDFISLEPMRGYWFETNQNCNVTFIGEVPQTNITTSLNYSFNVVNWFSAYQPRLGEEATLGNPLFVTPMNSIDNIFRYNVSKATNNPQLTGFQGLHHFSGYGWWPFFGDEDFVNIEHGSSYYLEIPNAPANWTHNPNFNN